MIMWTDWLWLQTLQRSFTAPREFATRPSRLCKKNKNQESIRAAAAARPRVQPKYDSNEGDVVYVWRRNPRANLKGWVGPGLIICLNPTHTSAWISMRGVVIETSTNRLRPANDQEWLGAELLKLLSAEPKQHLEKP